MPTQQTGYFKNYFDQSLLIIGLIPPPYGGVAIHVNRVVQILKKQNNMVEIVDVIKESTNRSKIGYCYFLIKKLFDFKPQVIHYHTLFLRSGLVELCILVLCKVLFRAKLVLVEHSCRFLYKRSKKYKYCLNKLMYFVDQQVLIGKPMLQAYRDNNITLKPNFSIESPFIPPQLEHREELFKSYPKEVFEFLNKFDVTLLMNASKFGLWDGKDIYGFDLCIRLMQELTNKNIGMVMIVGTVYDQQHYNLVKKQVDQYHNILLVTDLQTELWPLVELVDLFVRPSRFDNDSVSVAEACWLNKPVITSDVCPRPSGTILFKTGDYEDFKRAVLEWMEESEHASIRSASPIGLRRTLSTSGGGIGA